MVDKITKYLTFFFIVVYFLQGVLYESGSMVSQTTKSCILLIGLVFFVKSFGISSKNNVIVFMLLFAILNIIYWAFSVHNYHFVSPIIHEVKDINTINNLISTLFILFLFFITYNLSRANVINDKDMRTFFIVMLLISVVMYFRTLHDFNELKGLQKLNMEITNNGAYNFVHLLPFLFFFHKKRFWQFVFFTVCIAFIIMGIKRGAMICGVVFIFYFLHTQTKRVQLYKKVLLSIGIIAIVSFLSFHFLAGNEYFQMRLETTMIAGGTDASARNWMYPALWNYWLNCGNFFNYLFGFGFYSSYEIIGVEAHNDWLELLTTAGLLGVLIYFGLFHSIYRVTHENFPDSVYKNILYSILLIWFLKTLFSMGYTDLGMFPIFILLGYMCGRKKSVQIKQSKTII
jgi:hypothetical protein